jgi:hypothetical protein
MEHELKIYGASDDLIEIEGDFSEELNYPFIRSERERDLYLSVSDGTLLGIEYSESGVWRIHLISKGAAQFSKVDAPEDNEDCYSDVVTLKATDKFRWVMFGDQIAMRKK